MHRRRKSKQNIHFSTRSHPRIGILSLIMGSIALIILITLCLISGSDSGMSGPWIGIAGFWTLVLAIVGFVFAIRSYRMEDIYMITPMLGSIFNGTTLVAVLLLYVVGTVN
ncbi:MAG: hypothetical protein J5819_04465 [Eubacterium sp.]|nr:hypothetical protein [Eubacterium sp.]